VAEKRYSTPSSAVFRTYDETKSRENLFSKLPEIRDNKGRSRSNVKIRNTSNRPVNRNNSSMNSGLGLVKIWILRILLFFQSDVIQSFSINRLMLKEIDFLIAKNRSLCQPTRMIALDLEYHHHHHLYFSDYFVKPLFLSFYFCSF